MNYTRKILSLLSVILFLSFFIPFDNLVVPVFATSATGGTITYVGDYTIHTFTTSGTFTVTSGGSVEYIVVSGGGASRGGGGGGGGILNGTTTVTAQAYTITVGAGGSSSSGSVSTFSTFSPVGGGYGGGVGGSANGATGGSGGGGGGCGNNSPLGTGGAGTASQGSAGGNASWEAPAGSCGGGGGAGEVGENGLSNNNGGDGGDGIQNPIDGSIIGQLSDGKYYLGGGGGGSDWSASPSPAGLGGLGGGGGGESRSDDGNTAGTTNTGGGGGGYWGSGTKIGGTGVVIISYLTAVPPSAPLNVTIATTSTSAMTLYWATPTDCVNCTGYKIWNGSNNSVIQNDTSSLITSYSLSGLRSGTLQQLFVSAWNATGAGTNSSSASNYTINTAPVLDDVNSFNSTAFQLFYTINGTFNGIKVMIDEFPYATFSTLLNNSTNSSSTILVNGITNAVDTALKIFAHNNGGMSDESNQIINATSVTSAPTLNTVSQGSEYDLVLSWSAPSTGTATSYTVQRSPAGCASFATLSTGITATTYTDTATQASTTYCYQILSLNSQGSVDSNDVSQTSSASSGGGSGGGSSGGGTNPVGVVQTSILGLNFIDEIHRVILGQLLSDNIKVVWDSTNDLQITSIIVADSPFSVTFQQIPFTLQGDPSSNSEGRINYSVQTPTELCENGRTVACVQNLRYEIPVEIKAVHDSKTITKNTLIIIDMSGKTDIPFIFVLLAIVSVPIALVARKIKMPKKRKIEVMHHKSKKNGSARKSLEL